MICSVKQYRYALKFFIRFVPNYILSTDNLEGIF